MADQKFKEDIDNLSIDEGKKSRLVFTPAGDPSDVPAQATLLLLGMLPL